MVGLLSCVPVTTVAVSCRDCCPAGWKVLLSITAWTSPDGVPQAELNVDTDRGTLAVDCMLQQSRQARLRRREGTGSRDAHQLHWSRRPRRP